MSRVCRDFPSVSLSLFYTYHNYMWVCVHGLYVTHNNNNFDNYDDDEDDDANASSYAAYYEALWPSSIYAKQEKKERKTEGEREGEKLSHIVLSKQSSAALSAQWGQKGLIHLHISLSFAFDALLDLCLLHLSQLW